MHLWEEPIFDRRDKPELAVSYESGGVRVLTPMLPEKLSGEAVLKVQRDLLDQYLADENLENFIAWYYTPMAALHSRRMAVLMAMRPHSRTKYATMVQTGCVRRMLLLKLTFLQNQ